MQRCIKRFHRDECGATATEYALLVVFVALAVAAGASVLGGGVSNLLNAIGNKLSTIQLPTF